MSNTSKQTEFYNQPSEWQKHDSCWLAWPARRDLWEENLELAQTEFVDLCKSILNFDSKTQTYRGEKLNILVLNSKSLAQAEAIFKNMPVTLHIVTYGDIWLRDSAPIFIEDLKNKKLVNIKFGFNGWGEKYNLEGDKELGQQIAKLSDCESIDKLSFILEGGSIEADGQGTFLTTDQCLMNPNRNPHMSKIQIEEELKILGAKKVIWIKEGLLNDHTDGHIDTIARYVAPGEVVCMKAFDPETDPNSQVLYDIETTLKNATDALGRKLKVHTIPSPGLILNDDGEVMPASYVNFYISNTSVLVPIYGSKFDDLAVESLQKIFPDRKVIGLSAKAILSGGGAFHCITQQVPLITNI